VDATRPQKRTTKKQQEKRSREENVDNGLQVQLKTDGGGSIRQGWMEISGVVSLYAGSEKA